MAELFEPTLFDTDEYINKPAYMNEKCGTCIAYTIFKWNGRAVYRFCGAVNDGRTERVKYHQTACSCWMGRGENQVQEVYEGEYSEGF